MGSSDGHAASKLVLRKIEEAFSKIKRLLREIGVRTKEGLVEEATGKALDALSANDARGFFAHRGYRKPVQLL